MIPDFVTHYYLEGKRPFLSLSDLNGDTSNPIFVEMLNKHKKDPSYMRRYGESYLEMRKNAETKLRELFCKKGGKPTKDYPHYCVLGKSEWFRNLNDHHVSLELLIKDLPFDQVSLTFPDSFVAMTQMEKPYYEHVFMLDELDEMVSLFGLPEDEVPDSYVRYWEGDFEKYVEVQIWDDSIIPTQ